VYVDSAGCAGNGVQARASYDFNGDGTYDRVETYHYFATDPVAGWESYTQSSFGGLASSSGTMASFSAGAGRVQLQLWSAIGTCASTVRVDATSAQGSQSTLTTPQAASGGGGGGGGGGGSATPTLFVRSGPALSATAGTNATTVSIPSAGGANHDGTPTNAVSFLATGLSGTYTSGASAFNLYVDSGACSGNGVQARVSYDLNGDGTYDRVETYHYFATDPVSGIERYMQSSFGGLASSSGSLGSFTAGSGKVLIQLWSAIGTCASTVRVDATSAQGSQSTLTTPQT
jgi:hypothetical protein